MYKKVKKRLEIQEVRGYHPRFNIGNCTKYAPSTRVQ